MYSSINFSTPELKDLVVKCEGFVAFRGTMHFAPRNPRFPAEDITGDWLYKPDTGYWYCKGRSYLAELCTVMSVNYEAK